MKFTKYDRKLDVLLIGIFYHGQVCIDKKFKVVNMY